MPTVAIPEDNKDGVVWTEWCKCRRPCGWVGTDMSWPLPEEDDRSYDKVHSPESVCGPLWWYTLVVIEFKVAQMKSKDCMRVRMDFSIFTLWGEEVEHYRGQCRGLLVGTWWWRATHRGTEKQGGHNVWHELHPWKYLVKDSEGGSYPKG